MKFGENLYNLRKNKKMSQEELAERIGVSRQSVSKWENGTAYPEMNRILELCKIFHCGLNDLVNDEILDIDSLDEEVKMNVVKFNKEKQGKLKAVSKAIAVFSKIFQVVTLVISAVIIISMFFVPKAVNNTKISDGNIFVLERNLQEFQIDEAVSNKIINIFNGHTKLELILYAEIILVCIAITVLLISFAMLYLSKLFKNINRESTPFSLENLKNIKITSILFIGYLVFPDISGTFFEFITRINMNIEIELSKVLFILIIICIYYIFDYGHQIQLDSKGKIYGDENE